MKDKNDIDFRPFTKQWELIKESPVFKIIVILLVLAFIKILIF